MYFVGNEVDGFEPIGGTTNVANGVAFNFGHLFSASLCNGGPGPGFLSPWVYHYLTAGLKGLLEQLPGTLPISPDKYCKMYNELSEIKTDEKMQEFIMKDETLTMLEDIGFRGNPARVNLDEKNSILQSMFIKAKIEPVLSTLTEIRNGLGACYGMLQVLEDHVERFYPLFCSSDMFRWTHENFSTAVTAIFSEHGSSKKRLEVVVYKCFIDMVEDVFMNDESPISSGSLMKFITGSERMTQLRRPAYVSISFKHDCLPSCKCFPTISTCAFTITIPIHINDDASMLRSFVVGLDKDVGFGRC